jgi:hypothetical protein
VYQAAGDSIEVYALRADPVGVAHVLLVAPSYDARIRTDSPDGAVKVALVTNVEPALVPVQYFAPNSVTVVKTDERAL